MMQDGLLTQQIDVMLEMHAKKIIAQITALKSEIDSLREEFRKEFKEARKAQAAPAQQYGGQFGYAQAPMHDPQGVPMPHGQPMQGVGQFQPSMQQQARPASAPIDRNGVAPADVSIEKIFYSGGK